MTARLLAFVVWAAVAATAVFWALRLFVSAPPAPPNTVAAGTPGLARGDLTRLFGAEQSAGPAPVAQAPSRFQLLGVVAPQPGTPPRAAVALIAVDDKPPRAYRVGAPVDDRLVVQAVQGRIVSLGPRGEPAEVQLELPPLPPAATGTPGGAAGPSVTPPAPPPAPAAAPAPVRPANQGRQPAAAPSQRPAPGSNPLQEEEPPPEAQEDPPGIPR